MTKLSKYILAPVSGVLLSLPFSAKAQNLMPSGSPLYKLPYKNTYVMQTLVAENQFRTQKPEKNIPGSFEKARKVLPSPYWEGHNEQIDMYWKAWQIGIKNICQPVDGSGFVSSYIAPAYNGNIFMWDDSFITMFCRYGRRFFPFQNTLDNFYAKQHPDGFICREIRADGSDCFGRYDPTSTGPNLLPWSEWLYYTSTGDDNRLNKVFPVLAAYYKWLKLNRTWRNGTYWSSGWGTGMDNMPRVPEGYNTIYSNGHMVWLDACLQQIQVAEILLKMGFYLERWQEIEEFEDVEIVFPVHKNPKVREVVNHVLLSVHCRLYSLVLDWVGACGRERRVDDDACPSSLSEQDEEVIVRACVACHRHEVLEELCGVHRNVKMSRVRHLSQFHEPCLHVLVCLLVVGGNHLTEVFDGCLRGGHRTPRTLSG